jgi:hypothetical protein
MGTVADGKLCFVFSHMVIAKLLDLKNQVIGTPGMCLLFVCVCVCVVLRILFVDFPFVFLLVSSQIDNP